jgi:hypothetical protein
MDIVTEIVAIWKQADLELQIMNGHGTDIAIEGFIKVASRPEWRQIRIAVRERAKVAEPFIPAG